MFTLASRSELQCGEYGWYLMWLNNPPKKLCVGCLNKPEYRVVKLEGGNGALWLETERHQRRSTDSQRFVTSVHVLANPSARGPDGKSIDCCRITSSAICAQEITLQAALKRKGVDITKIEPYPEEPHAWSYQWQVFPGCVRLPYSLLCMKLI